jgi:hypothetical protein
MLDYDQRRRDRGPIDRDLVLARLMMITYDGGQSTTGVRRPRAALLQVQPQLGITPCNPGCDAPSDGLQPSQKCSLSAASQAYYPIGGIAPIIQPSVGCRGRTLECSAGVPPPREGSCPALDHRPPRRQPNSQSAPGHVPPASRKQCRLANIWSLNSPDQVRLAHCPIAASESPANRTPRTPILAFRTALADLLAASPGGIVYGRSATQIAYDFPRHLATTWAPGASTTTPTSVPGSRPPPPQASPFAVSASTRLLRTLSR